MPAELNYLQLWFSFSAVRWCCYSRAIGDRRCQLQAQPKTRRPSVVTCPGCQTAMTVVIVEPVRPGDAEDEVIGASSWVLIPVSCANPVARFLLFSNFWPWIRTIFVWARIAPHAAKHGQDRDEGREGDHLQILRSGDIRNFIENRQNRKQPCERSALAKVMQTLHD